MNIKPFSEIVSDNKEIKTTSDVKPFVDQAIGGKKVDEIEFYQEGAHLKECFLKRSMNFFASVQGFLVVFIIFILVSIGVDAIRIIVTLYQRSSVLDAIYLLALIILGIVLSAITYKNYQQIKMLKSAKKTQEFFSLQKINPNKEIVPATLKLLAVYILSKNETLQQKIQLLQSRINSSHDYKEIYKDLDEDIMNIIDAQVQDKIKTASIQAAVSTAISPLVILDSGIIIWRSFLLTKEIAFLYGFKSGWLSTFILLNHGAFNVFFAGVTELTSEYINEMAESSLVSKISISATQGLSNGILLARLGLGVMEACRPLPIRVKRGSFIKSMYLSIKNSVLDNHSASVS